MPSVAANRRSRGSVISFCIRHPHYKPTFMVLFCNVVSVFFSDLWGLKIRTAYYGQGNHPHF